MKLSSKAEMCICDEAGNDLWKGRVDDGRLTALEITIEGRDRL